MLLFKRYRDQRRRSGYTNGFAVPTAKELSERANKVVYVGWIAKIDRMSNSVNLK
jgi:hypothetical protein